MYGPSETRHDRTAATERNRPVAKAKDPMEAFHALIPLLVVVMVALAFVVR
jgi:hypothetical protein